MQSTTCQHQSCNFWILKVTLGPYTTKSQPLLYSYSSYIEGTLLLQDQNLQSVQGHLWKAKYLLLWDLCDICSFSHADKQVRSTTASLYTLFEPTKILFSCQSFLWGRNSNNQTKGNSCLWIYFLHSLKRLISNMESNMILLTLWVNYLTNPDNVVVIKLAQVLNLTQSSEWKALILHFFHQHIKFLQSPLWSLLGHRITILSFINFAECSFTNFFNIHKVWKFKLFLLCFIFSHNTLYNSWRDV